MNELKNEELPVGAVPSKPNELETLRLHRSDLMEALRVLIWNGEGALTEAVLAPAKETLRRITKESQ